MSDSIIAYHDLMQQNLMARWNGKDMPIADVLMTSEDVVWKAGSNTLLLYDRGGRRVLLFYRGRYRCFAMAPMHHARFPEEIS